MNALESPETQEAEALPLQPTAPFSGEVLVPSELVGPPPRRAPEAFYRGPLAQRRIFALQASLIAGAICAVIAPLPFVRTLSLYVLPLGYLSWIGLAIGVIGLIAYIRADEFRRARKYLEHGNAGFARVLALVKTPVVIQNGVATLYAFVAYIQLGDGADSEVVEVASRRFGAAAKDRVRTRFRVGDSVAVVWLPGQLASTVQIYDFLEAMPNRDLIRFQAKSRTARLLQTAGAVVGLAAFFLVIFWNLYAFGRYHPLDFDYARQGRPALLQGLTIAVVSLIAGVCIFVRQRRLRAAKNAEALDAGEAIEVTAPWSWKTWAIMLFLALPGFFFLCVTTVFAFAFTANAVFDGSPAQPVPVEITELTQTTHQWILRRYEIKFRREGDKRDSSVLTTPQQLDRFAAPEGIAMVRQGRFGWPWVETIEPAGAAD